MQTTIKPTVTAVVQFTAQTRTQGDAAYLGLLPQQKESSATEAPRTKPVADVAVHWLEPPFPPLEKESRTAVTTDAAAFYLNRKPQTLRAWACLENGPLRPIRVNGRLSWRVADIKSALDGEVAK